MILNQTAVIWILLVGNEFKSKRNTALLGKKGKKKSPLSLIVSSCPYLSVLWKGEHLELITPPLGGLLLVKHVRSPLKTQFLKSLRQPIRTSLPVQINQWSVCDEPGWTPTWETEPQRFSFAASTWHKRNYFISDSENTRSLFSNQVSVTVLVTAWTSPVRTTKEQHLLGTDASLVTKHSVIASGERYLEAYLFAFNLKLLILRSDL